MEFLGWYSIGDAPTEDDTHFHKQVINILNAALVFGMSFSILGHEVLICSNYDAGTL